MQTRVLYSLYIFCDVIRLAGRLAVHTGSDVITFLGKLSTLIHNQTRACHQKFVSPPSHILLQSHKLKYHKLKHHPGSDLKFEQSHTPLHWFVG